MRPTEIREHLRKQPFEPLRVYMSDGSHYDIRHPEMAAITRTKLFIGLDTGSDELPSHSVWCDPLHVTRIQPLDAA